MLARRFNLAWAVRVAVLAMIAVGVWTQAAWACSCARVSAEESFRRPGTIFVGTVIESRMLYPGNPLGGAETRVAVEDVIKGAPGAEVIIRHGTADSLCGIQFRPGQRQTFRTGLVVDGRTGTSLCAQAGGRPQEVEPIIARFRALVEAADEQIRSRPGEAEPVLARAALLEDWGDLDRALSGYRRASATWPQEERGWLGEGRILFRLNRLAQAIPALVHALALNAGNEEAQRMLDQARLRTGDGAALASMDLRGLQLQNRDLPPGDFTGRDFTGARWLSVSLRDSDLTGGRMAGVSFNRVDFSRTRLRNVAMTGARTYALDLTDADLQGADLSRSTLQGARLVRTNLDDLVGPDAKFEQATIAQASFARANLRAAGFRSATVVETDFSGARLDGADFRNAMLIGVDLSGARLDSVNFGQARFDCQTRFPAGFDPSTHGAVPLLVTRCGRTAARFMFDGMNAWRGVPNFFLVDLRGASFRQARLDSASFYGANLEGVDFTDAVGIGHVAGANLTNANLTNTRGLTGFVGGRGLALPPPILDGAVFRGATLQPSVFVGRSGELSADLTRARLEGATLSCVDLAVVSADPSAVQWREQQIAWVRALEPRRRGMVLDDSCDRVPELRDVR